MNRTTHLHRRAAWQRSARYFAADSIEWEELPSLAGTLRRNDFSTTSGHVWLSTEPMDLQPPASGLPAPFAEPIDGMHVREIEGESLFAHLFSDELDH
ncbi:MAG TPA: hypothetical protein VML58_05315 [Burkholderiaceae bacterium]|nr:hypothetical protein [Burkholderiaceae bacterium]